MILLFSLGSKAAGGIPPFLGIGSRQADADPVLVDLESQTALFIIAGLSAQLRILGSVLPQPFLQIRIIGVNLGGIIGCVKTDLGDFLLLFHA